MAETFVEDGRRFAQETGESMFICHARPLTALMLALGAVPASSAIYTYNQTIDLDPSFINGSGIEIPLPGSAFALAVGDSIQGTIQFVNDGRVTIAENGNGANETLVGLFLRQNGSDVQSTASFSFTGVQGNYTGPAVGSGGLSGGAIGFFTSADYTPTSFSFSGLTFTVNYTSGDATMFDPFFLDFERVSASITEGAVVPEPATWAMMLLGFGAVGHVSRRHHRSARRPVATA